MTQLAQTVLGLGSVLGNATESFPSPTAFVTVYAILWLGLVGWIAWLATRQHDLDRGVAQVHAQLQSRLDQADRSDRRTD